MQLDKSRFLGEGQTAGAGAADPASAAVSNLCKGHGTSAGATGCSGLQAVVSTIERASSQFSRAVKDALDPKRLSAGAASAGSGLLGGPGGATRADAPAPGTSAKWQVSMPICLKSAASCLSGLSAVSEAGSIQAKENLVG